MTPPKWSKDELARLMELLDQKLSDTQIATKLQRSQNSVSAKISRMQRAGVGYWRTRGRALTIWTLADELTASRMWREGNSARLISQALGERHSRNAVIGKMYRLGIDTPTKQPVALKPKKPRPKRVVKPRRPTAEERIMRFHSEGLNARDIACRQKVRKHVVVDVLVAAGMDPTANDARSYKVHPCWSMNDEDKRQYFYEKFQAGWATVLKNWDKPHV